MKNQELIEYLSKFPLQSDLHVLIASKEGKFKIDEMLMITDETMPAICFVISSDKRKKESLLQPGYMRQCETCENRDGNESGYYCMVLDEKQDIVNGVCSRYEGESEDRNETVGQN